MIKSEPHNEKLDIWSLGILLYEILHGFPPFNGQNAKEKCQNILNNSFIEFKNISIEAKDLITKILKKNPNERLTLEEIFKHKWMIYYEKVFDFKIENFLITNNKNKKKRRV